MCLEFTFIVNYIVLHIRTHTIVCNTRISSSTGEKKNNSIKIMCLARETADNQVCVHQ